MATFITVLLDGLAYGMILFIISVGLTVIMGLMRVVNLAHGAFAMCGGYLAATMIGHGIPFVIATLVACLATAALGAGCERAFYRPLYRTGEAGELAQVMMTFGLTFVIGSGLAAIFGVDEVPLPLPAAINGLWDFGLGVPYPVYKLVLIAVGVVITAGLWVLIDGSLFGARLRAAVDNPRMARAVGMDVDRLLTLTFAIGCGLAALGGVLGADLLPLEPFYALRYLVLFLVVVSVGGLGNFKGSLVSALALGELDNLGKFLLPNLSAYLLFALVCAMLLWRPNGLVPAKSAA